MSWLSGYTYQKKCTVVATTAGAQTNYQLELKVGESSGASGETVDCESNCQDFPNDIRFTEEDGETKHDYWIESITGTTPNRLAIVIIEVASIPASGSVDFYMYYGKSADSGEGNGDNTFESFDDATEYNQEIYHGVAGGLCPAVTLLDNDNLLLFYYHYSTGWLRAYLSEDDGDTWSLLSTPYSGDAGHNDVTSHGNNDVWLVCRNSAASYFQSKKSADGGATWASAVNIRDSTNACDIVILYVSSNLLLVAIADNAASPHELEIWKSVDNGSNWSFVINAKTSTAAFEDMDFGLMSNGNIILTYEKEWVDGGHSGVYCTISSDNGASWGSEITIYDDGTYDNEGGCLLVDGSTLYHFIETDEDASGGSYKNNNVKRLKSEDNGLTWGSKTLVMDTKFTIEPDVIKAANGKVLFFGTRQYPSASRYVYQVEIDMNTPKLFASKWTQDAGAIYSIVSGTEEVLGVEGLYDAGKRCFVVNSLNIEDCIIEFSSKAAGSTFDLRSVCRYADTNNHYLIAHTSTHMKIFKAVAGSYTELDAIACLGNVDTWYKYKIQFLGENIKTWVDDVLKNDINDTTFTIGKTGLSSNYLADRNPSLFDDYRVRKYVSPGPTWGTWGYEDKEIFDSEVGICVDIALGVQAAVINAEVGMGTDAILAALSSRSQADVGTGIDALIALIDVKIDSDVGTGIDTLTELLGNLEDADAGVGVDVVAAILATLTNCDTGAGADICSNILAELEDSDLGVGMDELADLLAAVQQSDLGSGIEAEIRVIWIYLMLKLLQAKKLNISTSQGKKPDLKLSQEQK